MEQTKQEAFCIKFIEVAEILGCEFIPPKHDDLRCHLLPKSTNALRYFVKAEGGKPERANISLTCILKDPDNPNAAIGYSVRAKFGKHCSVNWSRSAKAIAAHIKNSIDFEAILKDVQDRHAADVLADYRRRDIQRKLAKVGYHMTNHVYHKHQMGLNGTGIKAAEIETQYAEISINIRNLSHAEAVEIAAAVAAVLKRPIEKGL